MTQYPHIFIHQMPHIRGNASIVWGLNEDGEFIMSSFDSAEDARNILKAAGFNIIRERVSSLS